MHRKGIGKHLFQAAYEYGQDNGFEYMQVKTLKTGCDKGYDKTNLFYQSLGFREFECFPTLWGKDNPCQIYVMAIHKK